ncbi:hypothetical protein MKW92_032063, partial [Papaver armeniacum]
ILDCLFEQIPLQSGAVHSSQKKAVELPAGVSEAAAPVPSQQVLYYSLSNHFGLLDHHVEFNGISTVTTVTNDPWKVERASGVRSAKLL